MENPLLRVAEPCDPSPVPVPEEFIFPVAPGAPATVTPQAPDPLILVSRLQVVICDDLPDAGPMGLPVTVPEGYTNRSFYWTDIPRISASQLGYIGALSDYAIQLAADPAFTVEQIANVFSLQKPQAIYMRAKIDALQAEANTQARAAGLSQLDCFWENSDQTASCPDGALISPFASTAISVVNPFTSAASTFKSKESQVEANQMAATNALINLSCWYGNEAITVTCRDIGFAEDVPVDTALVGASRSLRVGSIVIPANSFFSEDSVNEANDSARAAALLRLSCFFINAPVIKSCQDVGYAAGTIVRPVSAASGLTGNPVTVPAGFVTSTISSADAAVQAEALAISLLDCLWGNSQQSATCGSREVKNRQGAVVTLEASDKSPAKNTVIPAGQVLSTVSQKEADAQAALMATMQLNCVYCNEKILPLCLPASVASVNPLPVPIPASWLNSKWSIDATTGMAAGTICSESPEEAVNISDSVSSIPAASQGNGSNCHYANDEVIAACIASPADGVVGIFNAESGAGLSEKSYPNPYAPTASARTMSVSAGTVVLGEDEIPSDYLPGDDERAKKYVNSLARSMAISFLNCFFENKAALYTCAATLKLEAVSPESTDNILVPAGSFTSTVSQAEAQLQADVLGKASLFCFYGNKAGMWRCNTGMNNGDYVSKLLGKREEHGEDYKLIGDGRMDTLGGDSLVGWLVSDLSKGSIPNPIVIEDSMFISLISQKDADDQAEAMAISMLDCFWTNQEIGVYCQNYGVGAQGVPFVMVPTDIFRSKKSPEDAYNQALAYGKAQTFCYYGNQAVTMTCPNGRPNADYNPTLDPPQPVNPEKLANGAANPDYDPNKQTTSTDVPFLYAPGAVTSVTVDAATHSSLTTQHDANAVATVIAKASLRCFYGNEKTESGACAPGLFAGPKVTLPADTIVSGTQKGADSTATSLANALHVCSESSLEGLPGPAGAQKNCTGKCFGYYS